jgi:hypothetical protein
MKTNILKSIFAIASLAVIATSCVDDDYATPTFDCIETTLVKNKEVADIPASAIVTRYAADDIIEAYVVSSDKEGNFYKSVSFQTLDGSKAFSVPMDIEATFATFDVGRKVLIKMQGLYTDISNGGMRIGGLFVTSDGEASVGRLTRAQVKASLFSSCTVKSETDLVKSIALTDVAKDENINKLIEISGVQFDNDAVSDTYYNEDKDLGGATNHMITDRFGAKLIFRTSSFAAFANKTVPSGSGKIRGVLTKFDTDYQFVARYESDIQLTQPRSNPYPAIFSENFEGVNSLGNGAFLNLLNWTNKSLNSTATNPERWEGRTFDNNKYAQMSFFGITEPNGDVRLITPAVNLNATANDLLKFGIKNNFFNGVALTVWYSTDYNGLGTTDDINAATWTQLTTNIGSIQDTSFADEFYEMFVPTSAINGANVHFSFRYQGGTTSGITTLYQVDNIQVVGGN